MNSYDYFDIQMSIMQETSNSLSEHINKVLMDNLLFETYSVINKRKKSIRKILNKINASV